VSESTEPEGHVSTFAILAPGILVAATGVGAGDLLTASIAGSVVGVSILWAAPAGAILKYFLTEGVARWQMATRTTLLEGWLTRFGPLWQWVFLSYLLLWSFFVGGALVSACGVAGAGLLPLGDDLRVSKSVWGVVHSLAGYCMVRFGGYRFFEKAMSAMVGLMFVTVMLTALLMRPDLSVVLRGCLLPTIPKEGVGWLIGVLGGVGGTVTLLSYGYWIRERGRRGVAGLRVSRLDLGVGYLMTALFGLSMVMIGAEVRIEKGPAVALELAGQIELILGPAGRWVFLVGFWGAVFSSLLGVWQSIPYLFADTSSLMGGRGRNLEDLTDKDGSWNRSGASPLSETRAYRWYLLGLTVAPLCLLWVSVQQVQLIYAIFGAFFMPMLALSLLIMNNRVAWVGKAFRNGWIVNSVLVITLVFFVYMAAREVVARAEILFGL
jgi:Mn2+/Fe2+ NRAMP family transporter